MLDVGFEFALERRGIVEPIFRLRRGWNLKTTSNIQHPTFFLIWEATSGPSGLSGAVLGTRTHQPVPLPACKGVPVGVHVADGLTARAHSASGQKPPPRRHARCTQRVGARGSSTGPHARAWVA